MAENTDNGGAAAAAGSNVSRDEAKRMVDVAVADALAKQNAGAARSQYISTKMADLPEAYRDRLAQSGDAAELGRSEADVRKAYQDDLAKAGARAADLSGVPAGSAAAARAAGGGGGTAAGRSATERIAAGLAANKKK